MRLGRAASSVLAWMVATACASVPPAASMSAPTDVASVRYVALGDSYTIGTSVAEVERFPNQLVDRLRGVVDMSLVANLGVNGYTTRDLIAFELPEFERIRPDFVTLLIGVNDVVRGDPVDRYRANVDRILGAILGVVPADRVLVVSVPDYTRTPRGADFGDPAQQRAAIGEVNRVMREATALRGIAFVDIGAVADQAGSDASLVARDGLHPSGTQYGRWVDLIAPVAVQVLDRDRR